MTALRQLSDLLPAEWPNSANTSPEWWEKHGKTIKLEDWLAQAELDLLLNRSPEKTGSRPAIQVLRVEGKGRSQNHKKSAATCVLLRDNNPAYLLNQLRDEERMGFMYLEQFARYVRFHARDAFAALLYLDHASIVRRDMRQLRDAVLRWLSACWWWLDSAEWQGEIYTCGCRREFAPEVLDGFLLKVFRGEPVDTKNRQMGHSPGSRMNGGMPRACDVWLGLACREAGLLKGLEPKDPKLAWPVVVEKSDAGILSFFPKLHWRPGQGPILAAVEMQKSWKEPQLWLSPDKEPLPSEWWGFSPHTRRLEAAA